MQAPYYPNCNVWYPIGSCYSDMCQASQDSMLRMQQSKLNAYTFEGFNRLNHIDEQSASGKLDLIIQLPYTVKTPIKRAQAEERRKDIEAQLTGSRYGIAYIDSTEHITQLNRSLHSSICNTIYYADNAPYYGLNEDCVVEVPAKKKLTIYDLARLVFPDDPIRDYVEKKVAEIEERYRWIDAFY